MLLAAAAWLAVTPPAAAQQNEGRVRPPAPPERSYALSDLSDRPRLLNGDEIERQIASLYPPAMRAAGVAGIVVLRFRILADGTVDPASVSAVEATDTAFVAPATAVGRRLAFSPARVEGRPVAFWHRVDLRFVPRRPDGPPNGVEDAGNMQPPGVAQIDPPDDGTYELSTVEVPPRIQNGREMERQIAARYPRDLLESGVSGTVVVRFRILADGRVDASSVSVESATNAAFRDAATAVVRQMRFTPARVGRWPVKVWVTLPIYFQRLTPVPEKGDSAATGTPAGPGAAAPAPDPAPRGWTLSADPASG